MQVSESGYLMDRDKRSPSEYEVPLRESDAYADYVLDQGRRYSLNRSQLQQIESAITLSVVRSRAYLIDSHTSHAIEATLLNALHHSDSFRAALGFGVNQNLGSLADIRYENRYETDEQQFLDADLSDFDSMNIYAASPESCPIVNVAENREGYRDGLRRSIINIGAAPMTASLEYLLWQEGLIHEVIHAVTGALDPSEESDRRLGPTEILARRMAQELGWQQPVGLSYGAFERNRQIEQRNYAALIALLNRHADHEEALMQRMATIADGVATSVDFNEIEAHLVTQTDLPAMPDFDEAICIGAFFFTGVASEPINHDDDCAVNEKVAFASGQFVNQMDLKALNLSVAEIIFRRVNRGSGFYSTYKDSYRSWKEWYRDSSWVTPVRTGLFDYGESEAKGYWFWNAYGYVFGDGSFSVGVTGLDAKSTDNWVGDGPWGGQYDGQMFFDFKGRPVALVITNQVAGFFGSGWSYVYNNGQWDYESTDDWDLRRFNHSVESLDVYAPQFKIDP